MALPYVVEMSEVSVTIPVTYTSAPSLRKSPSLRLLHASITAATFQGLSWVPSPAGSMTTSGSEGLIWSYGLLYGSGTSSQEVKVNAAMAIAIMLKYIFFIILNFQFSIINFQLLFHFLHIADSADDELPLVSVALDDASDVYLSSGQLLGSKVSIVVGVDLHTASLSVRLLLEVP